MSGRADCEDFLGEASRREGERACGSLAGTASSSESELISWLADGTVASGNSGCEEDGGSAPDTEGVLAVGGRSSGTVDCLLVLNSSSASSAISIKRLRRSELVEEEVEPEAVCREQAAESVVSRNSFDVVMGKVVS